MSLWTIVLLILAVPLGLAAPIVALMFIRRRLADDDDEIGSGLIFDDEDFQPWEAASPRPHSMEQGRTQLEVVVFYLLMIVGAAIWAFIRHIAGAPLAWAP